MFPELNDVTRVVEIVIFLIYFFWGFHAVNQWQRVPVMFFGWYAWTAGPGIIWVPPIIFQLLKAVPVQDAAQRILVENARTQDNIPLSFEITIVTRVLPERVRDVVVNIEDGRNAVKLLAETAAVEIVGNTNYEHIQGEEKKFSEDILKILRERVSDWGIEVSQLGISNIVITDKTIAESVSKVARARTDAKAEGILSEALKTAADTYGVGVWELRQLIALTGMATDGKGSVIPVSHNIGDIMKLMSPELLQRVSGGRTDTAGTGVTTTTPNE